MASKSCCLYIRGLSTGWAFVNMAQVMSLDLQNPPIFSKCPLSSHCIPQGYGDPRADLGGSAQCNMAYAGR
jgi:hypothetical protein